MQDQLIDTTIACWNEAAARRRAALAAEAFAADATYVDPLMEGRGPDGIGAGQARFPGLRFRRSGRVDAHHGPLRFCWEPAAGDGPAVAAGTDVAELAADGRFARVPGFIDLAPEA
ncbi:nuclear transport factor 2 family protein [Belnapia sp. F-4-1]|uniref:nuclear transport factor 2 family protein n=1 Tax=Belnapia sp. F-4-1 TaxID=1545443 RepID=UPI0005BE0202|nr:nuclear transport factor 2 family protein [Belnapia sp. F-4-1]